MPALDLAQEELGHLTPEAMSQVAELRSSSIPGYVEGVATFYTLLPPRAGRQAQLLHVHQPELPAARSGGLLSTRLKDAIGVREPGEVSKDGSLHRTKRSSALAPASTRR